MIQTRAVRIKQPRHQTVYDDDDADISETIFVNAYNRRTVTHTRVHIQRCSNENGATSRVKYIAPFQFYFFLLGVYFRDALDHKEIRNDIIPPEIPLWIVDS